MQKRTARFLPDRLIFLERSDPEVIFDLSLALPLLVFSKLEPWNWLKRKTLTFRAISLSLSFFFFSLESAKYYVYLMNKGDSRHFHTDSSRAHSQPCFFCDVLVNPRQLSSTLLSRVASGSRLRKIGFGNHTYRISEKIFKAPKAEPWWAGAIFGVGYEVDLFTPGFQAEVGHWVFRYLLKLKTNNACLQWNKQILCCWTEISLSLNWN